MSESNEGVPHVVFNYDAPTAEEHEFEACLGAIYLECPEPVADDVNRIVRARITQFTQANAALEARNGQLSQTIHSQTNSIVKLEAQLAEARKENHYTRYTTTLHELEQYKGAYQNIERERAELREQLVEARKELDSVLSRVSEIEIIPGQVAVPFFKTDEEYQAFREWWQQNVTEALKRPDVERGQLRERCEKLEAAIQLFQEWTQSADGPYPSVINKASEIFDAILSASPQKGDGK